MKVFLYFVLVLIFCCPSLASYKGLIFYAPFEKSVSPEVASGSPDVQVLKGDSSFTKGMTGSALVTGGEYGFPTYPVKDNLCDEQGSISLWVKPIDWGPDRKNHIYFEIPGRLVMYWYGPSVWTAFLWMDGEKVVWGNAGYPGGGIDQGQWGHLAFTWGETGCVMYFNGEFLRKTDGNVKSMYSESKLSDKDRGQLKRWAYENARFHIGHKISQTAFDEFMAFDRELSPAEVLSLYRRGSRDLSKMEFAVPVIEQPRVDESEPYKAAVWGKASGATAFIDSLGHVTDKDVSARFFADSEHLYIMAKSEQSAAKEDDFLEIQINTLKADKDSERAFKVSAQSDQKQPADVEWNAKHFVVEGKDVFFIAIPFRSIGVDIDTDPELGVNIIRKWSDEYDGWVSLADPASEGYRYANIKFVKNATAFNLESVGDIQYANLEIKADLINLSEDNQSVDILIELKPKDLQEFIDEAFVKTYSGPVLTSKESAVLPPGLTGFSFSRQINDTDIDSVYIHVADSDGALIYSQHIPFICTPALLTNVETFPEHDRVDVILDTSEYRESSPEELTVEVSFHDSMNNRVGYTEVKPLKSRIDTASYPLSKLPEGEITVNAQLKTLQGKDIFSYETKFEKLAPGPWMDNKMGLDDTVIPPFTPIQVDGQEISVWNRRYVWNDSLFPVEIYAGGVSLLDAPIELYTTELPTGEANNADLSFIEQSDTKVIIETEARIDDIPVVATTTIEYDGMIYTELTFKPYENSVLPRLAVAMPMKSEEAWLYHYYGHAGAVSDMASSATEAVSMDIPWNNNIWLGTPGHGLAWFSETHENWKLDDNPTPLRISQENGVTSLITTIAKSEHQIKSDTNLRFGFIATPVKPMRDNWRFFRVHRDWVYSWFNPMMNSNNHISKMNPSFPEYVKSQHEKGLLFVPYLRPDWMNMAAKEQAYYRQEWQRVPSYISGTDGGGVPGENQHLSVCLGSDWQDYLLYHEMQVVDKSGCDGFYHDGAEAIECKNEYHNHGYTDIDGKRHTIKTILDTRQYYKRLAVELNKRKESWQDYLIFLHQSHHFALPAFSFASLGWDGEQHSYAMPVTQDYTKLLTPEAFVAQWHGKQFGYPVQWLVQFHNMDGKQSIGKAEVDTGLCLALITGTQELMFAGFWAGPENSEYALSVADRADEFGLSHGRADFIGWWENGEYVELNPENRKIKCSLWKSNEEDKILLMLGNANGDKERPAKTSIAINRQSLELGEGELSIMDWWTKEKLEMVGDVIEVEIGGSSWRMISIRAKE